MQNYKTYLEKNFEEIYKKLNVEQKKAVDKIDGAVMVVAGPGTGKTQILSARIGKILLDTDYQPSNILCLTYTDAGVTAMRKRLLSMIGPDAYSVNLHTFHSFCNMVIQQNMHLFHKKELQPMSELEKMQCMKTLIDELENDNKLKRFKTDAYYEARHLLQLFSAIKREGWTVEMLNEKVDEYVIKNIPELFANKTKLKKGITELTIKGKEEIERMERLKAAVAIYPRYIHLQKQMLRYDYDDMINWVIKAFEENADLLAGYQEQFQFILVDEYQDTSGAQNKLVELLISYWKDESPNIFVVGDDDQSIFRFQGANLENMLLLSKKYDKDLLRVVLTKNYRSLQSILDAAHSLIGHNSQRLCNEHSDFTKTLTAAREEYKGNTNLPLIRTVNNEFEENILVASEIKELVDDGIAPGKIAVIYKQHRTGAELQRFFQLNKIPFYTKKDVNLLDEIFINKILTFFNYVVAETEIPYSGEEHLFNILHYDFYKIFPLKIAAICNEVAMNDRNNTEPATLRQYLSNLATVHQTKLFSENDDIKKLIDVHLTLEKLISESKNVSLIRWMELLVGEAGILAFAMAEPNKGWLMQMLNGFFDFMQDECRRNPPLTINDFLKQVDILKDNGIDVSLAQTSGNENGVNLLTCHGSKGLEYEYVFFMGCYSALWEKFKRTNQGMKIPPNVFEKETADEAEEELRRLFFVATTRAEQHLRITIPLFTNEGKPLEISRFIEELRSNSDIQIQHVNISEEQKINYTTLRFGILHQPEIEQAEKDYVDALLKNFRMNVTALNNYLDCPVKFYYSSLVRVPGSRTETTQFGSSMHAALNNYYVKMMEDASKRYSNLDVLLNYFSWHINNNREVFTPESLKRYHDHGVICLTKFYAREFENAKPGDFIRTEVAMNAVVNGIPVKGFADKIQYWGNDIIITDFKTGKFSNAIKYNQFVEPGSQKKPEGGDYWRQAVFYKILMDNSDGKKKNVQGINFQYIEPDSDGIFKLAPVSVTTEHEEIVKQQIADVWQKIQEHDFYTGCGKEECHWCNFIKDNKLHIALHELQPEEPELI